MGTAFSKVLWEDMTAGEFARAVRKSAGVCLLPMGVIEKHGEHLPLGTDLFTVRHVAEEAAKREYAVVFPPYYFGQINEARHQPGTVALRFRLLMDLLREACGEIARNGFPKIILCNGHGGNIEFTRFFCQCALEEDHGYSLYAPPINPSGLERDEELRGLHTDKYDGHAGEWETSEVLAIHPDKTRMGDDIPARGLPLKGLGHLEGAYSGIWWYALHPEHYAGQGRLGSAEKGRIFLRKRIEYLARVIRAVKRDRAVPGLEREFHNRARKPVK